MKEAKKKYENLSKEIETNKSKLDAYRDRAENLKIQRPEIEAAYNVELEQLSVAEKDIALSGGDMSQLSKPRGQVKAAKQTLADIDKTIEYLRVEGLRIDTEQTKLNQSLVSAKIKFLFAATDQVLSEIPDNIKELIQLVSVISRHTPGGNHVELLKKVFPMPGIADSQKIWADWASKNGV